MWDLKQAAQAKSVEVVERNEQEDAEAIQRLPVSLWQVASPTRRSASIKYLDFDEEQIVVIDREVDADEGSKVRVLSFA